MCCTSWKLNFRAGTDAIRKFNCKTEKRAFANLTLSNRDRTRRHRSSRGCRQVINPSGYKISAKYQSLEHAKMRIENAEKLIIEPTRFIGGVAGNED